jgi:hypothetical protein
MSKKNKKKADDVKQLLNFTEKQCLEYDISEFRNNILAIYGGDTSRILNLRFFIDFENKNEINNFITQKGKESAIKKRIRMAVHSIMTSKRDDTFYEVEYAGNNSGIPFKVGAIKFHSQNNVRVICREFNETRTVILIMVEGYKKKVEGNTGKYQNRLIAASKIRYFYIDEKTRQKIFL